MKGTTGGNLFFWLGIICGIPLIGTIYSRDDRIRGYFMHEDI